MQIDVSKLVSTPTFDYLAHPLLGTLKAFTDAEDATWIPLDEVKNMPATKIFVSILEDAIREGLLEESTDW